MRLDDQQRFAEFVAEFVDSCGIDRPFHLICIDANGSVNVTHLTESTIDELCAQAKPGGLIAPLVLTVIAPDGRGRSAVIEIEAGRGLRMM